MNTRNRLRYFLKNKIFLLHVMYRYVRMIFIVKCVTITSFFIAYAALWWKSMIFIVLSSLETVHDTVEYRYSIFSLLYRLSRIMLPAEGRQHRGGCIIPQAVTHSLVLLKMGKIISRNMLS